MNHLSRTIICLFVGVVLALSTVPLPEPKVANPVEVKPAAAKVEVTPLLPLVETIPVKPVEVSVAPVAPRPPVQPADTYPAYLRDAAPDTISDPYLMFNRECTSYAAHKVLEQTGYKIWGWYHAKFWPEEARKAGKTVTTTPTSRTAAISTEGDYGHVGWVISVSGGSVTVSEYNGAKPYAFAITTYPPGFFTEFIRF